MRIEPAQDTTETGFRYTVYMERVSHYLEIRGEQTKNAIESDVRGKAEHIRAALVTLEAEGFVTRRDGPHGSSLFVSTKPYRDTDEWPRPTSSHLVRDDLVPRPPIQGDEDGRHTRTAAGTGDRDEVAANAAANPHGRWQPPGDGPAAPQMASQYISSARVLMLYQSRAFRATTTALVPSPDTSTWLL